jgi:hypothetical protein
MGKCFEFRDAFPPMEDVIEELCQRNAEARHDTIVNEFIKNKQGFLVVEAASARCPEHTRESMASNMLQWFSQQYTLLGNLETSKLASNGERSIKVGLFTPLIAGFNRIFGGATQSLSPMWASFPPEPRQASEKRP